MDSSVGVGMNSSIMYENEMLVDDVRNRQIYEKYLFKNYMIEESLKYSKSANYRRLLMYQDDRIDRNLERDGIQNDANIVVLRKDCNEANFADYIPSSVDNVYDGGLDLRLESINNIRDDNNNVMIEVGKKCNGIIEELVLNGMSPGEVAKLSDVFEYPSIFKNVNLSMISWLEYQKLIGYWSNNASLFILCLTIALSVGSLETIFKLNTTWDGMIFLLTYFLSYIFIVQPVICLELLLGQLYRISQTNIYDKLVYGSGGIGTTMVLLCIISGCVACSRISAEYMLYFIDVFNKKIPWKLTQDDINKCISIINLDECNKLSPLCSIVDNKCIANELGKAYLIYQNKFDNINIPMDKLNYELVISIICIYIFVSILSYIGFTNFTFCTFILLILVFFLYHMQVYCTMILDGALNYLWNSFKNWEFKYLYTNSRIWTHSIRCCIYEYIIGNGIYSTLSSKSRIGYDLSSEAVGVGICSGYITMLLFIIASGLVGFYTNLLKTLPNYILSMIEQDCNFILLPLGFQTTKNMEHTLCVLLFGCSFLLVSITLTIQIEVAIMSIEKFSIFKNINRKFIGIIVSIFLMIITIPLCNRNGKHIIWFLEIAVGDLGRVFMVFMTCLVVGWLYGTREQINHVGKKQLYTFNSIFWITNIIVSICEIIDEQIPLVIWWSLRITAIIVAGIVALLSFKGNDKKSLVYWLYIGNVDLLRKEFIRLSPMSTVSNITMTIFWSISIKWIAICFLSSSLADIIEEMISTNNIVNLNHINHKSKIITLFIWAIFILIIATHPFLVC